MPPTQNSRIEWNTVTWYSKTLAIILFVALICGAFWFGNWYAHQMALATSEPVEEFSGNTQQTTPAADAPVSLQSSAGLTSIDGVFYKDSSSVYLKQYGNASSNDVSYEKVASADPSTFKLLGSVHLNQENLKGEVDDKDAYYADSKQVFFLYDRLGMAGEDREVYSVPGASPSTFVGLNSKYGKDATGVYAMKDLCPESSACTTKPTMVEGADLPTFKAFQVKTIANPSDRDDILVDASDKNSFYYNGEKVASSAN